MADLRFRLHQLQQLPLSLSGSLFLGEWGAWGGGGLWKSNLARMGWVGLGGGGGGY